MTDPVEYEERGSIYVEGKCAICGKVTRNTIKDIGAGE
jgi:hypothetical protein